MNHPTRPPHQPGPFEEVTADSVTFFTLILTAGLAGPALLVAFRDIVIGWALQHNILVPAHQATWVIPSTPAGLDPRRITVGVLLLLAVIAGTVVLARTLPTAQSRRRPR